MWGHFPKYNMKIIRLKSWWKRFFKWIVPISTLCMQQSKNFCFLLIYFAFERKYCTRATIVTYDKIIDPLIWRRSHLALGFPLQCYWVSLVTQLVKNPPAMQETWVWSLGWADPLEKGKATYSSILAWRIP